MKEKKRKEKEGVLTNMAILVRILLLTIILAWVFIPLLLQLLGHSIPLPAPVLLILAHEDNVLRMALRVATDQQLDDFLEQAFDLAGLVVGVAEVEAGNGFGSLEIIVFVAGAVALFELIGDRVGGGLGVVSRESLEVFV